MGNALQADGVTEHLMDAHPAEPVRVEHLGRNVSFRLRHPAHDVEDRVAIAVVDAGLHVPAGTLDGFAHRRAGRLMKVRAHEHPPHGFDERSDRRTLRRCEWSGAGVAQDFDLIVEPCDQGGPGFGSTGMVLPAGRQEMIARQPHQRILRLDRGGGPVRLSATGPVEPPGSAVVCRALADRATHRLLAQFPDHCAVHAGLEGGQLVELLFTFVPGREHEPEKILPCRRAAIRPAMERVDEIQEEACLRNHKRARMLHQPPAFVIVGIEGREAGRCFPLPGHRPRVRIEEDAGLVFAGELSLGDVDEEPQQPHGREEDTRRSRYVAKIDLGDEGERAAILRADRPLQILPKVRQPAQVTARLLPGTQRPPREENPLAGGPDRILARLLEPRGNVGRKVGHGGSAECTQMPPSRARFRLHGPERRPRPCHGQVLLPAVRAGSFDR